MKNSLFTWGLAGITAAAALGVAAWRAHQLRPRDIPVLMYHNVLQDGELSVWQVSEEEFGRQMAQLEEAGYTTVLPRDIERASRGWGWLPEKPVVITFDDGYEGVAKCAEPILARHGMKAICYPVVGLLAKEGEERATFDSGPILTAAEAAAMARRGVVALGSHSLTHSRGNPRQLAAEIGPSRGELRRRTGVKPSDFCYPHGLHGYDYMYDALRRSHFRTAMACGDRMFRYGTDTNLLAIPRLSVFGGRHDIRVESVLPEKGEVWLVNSGSRIPLRVRIEDEAGNRRWESDMQTVGGTGPVVYRFPPEALEGERSIEAWDQAGLFRYMP